MDDLRRDEQADAERALDANEKWGQGTDLSHPDSATGQPIEDRNEPGDEFGGERDDAGGSRSGSEA